MKILENKLIAECTEYDFKGDLERKKLRHWLKSVSAFANTQGGAIYFGVSNDGTVTGLADPQGDSDFISEKINAHLDPIPDWSLTPTEDEQGNKLLELFVRPGQFTPYYLYLDGSRQAYVRSGNESKQASHFKRTSKLGAERHQPQLGRPSDKRDDGRAQLQNACTRI